ncbi:hypothetical protein BDR22DRAFT_845297 [Usnea florida]
MLSVLVSRISARNLGAIVWIWLWSAVPWYLVKCLFNRAFVVSGNNFPTCSKRSLNRRVQCAVDFAAISLVGTGPILLSHRTPTAQTTSPISSNMNTAVENLFTLIRVEPLIAWLAVVDCRDPDLECRERRSSS